MLCRQLGIQTQRARLCNSDIDAIDRFTAAGGVDIPRHLGCDPKDGINRKANLLDDGVVDTLGSAGATSNLLATFLRHRAGPVAAIGDELPQKAQRLMMRR